MVTEAEALLHKNAKRGMDENRNTEAAKCGPKYLHSRPQKLRRAVQSTCTRGHKQKKAQSQLTHVLPPPSGKVSNESEGRAAVWAVGS